MIDLDQTIKKFIAVATTTTITAISAYYIWQFIIGIPLLQSLVAIATTITIIVLQAIIVWYVVGSAIHAHRMNNVEIGEIRMRNLVYDNENRLPPP